MASRATHDADVVTDLGLAAIAPFAHALGSEFDIDVEALADAFRHRKSWNIFFLPDFTKIDLFPVGPRPYDLAAFARRKPVEVARDTRVFVIAPEDILLKKLRWFRDGDHASQQQWRDVLGVLRVSGPGLDSAYLAQWAPELGVMDLLARAREEADRG